MHNLLRTVARTAFVTMLASTTLRGVGGWFLHGVWVLQSSSPAVRVHVSSDMVRMDVPIPFSLDGQHVSFFGSYQLPPTAPDEPYQIMHIDRIHVLQGPQSLWKLRHYLRFGAISFRHAVQLWRGITRDGLRVRVWTDETDHAFVLLPPSIAPEKENTWVLRRQEDAVRRASWDVRA